MKKLEKFIFSGLPLKKILHPWLSHAQKTFIAMACDSKLHVMILWCVMSMKLNFAKKIAGLEIMALNCGKCSISPNL